MNSGDIGSVRRDGRARRAAACGLVMLGLPLAPTAARAANPVLLHRSGDYLLSSPAVDRSLIAWEVSAARRAGECPPGLRWLERLMPDGRTRILRADGRPVRTANCLFRPIVAHGRMLWAVGAPYRYYDQLRL